MMPFDPPLVLRLAVLGLLMALAGVIAVGFFGRLHPAFDSFSHFRIHLAVLLLVGVLPLAALRYWPEAGFAALVGLGALAATLVPPAIGADRDPRLSVEIRAPMPLFRLLHLNLRFDNATPELVLSAIGAHRPDVVTLAEVSDLWRAKLPLLEASYPFQIVCPQPTRNGGVAILSRRPFVENRDGVCANRGSFAKVEIDFLGRKTSVAALHLGWPWPFDQAWNIGRIADQLPGLNSTAILAGDFNAVPWSHTVRRVAELGSLRIIRGIGPTWLDRRLPAALRPWVGLPIDQLLVKGGIVIASARTLEAAGSDHLPVLVEFSLLPQEPDAEILQAMGGD